MNQGDATQWYNILSKEMWLNPDSSSCCSLLVAVLMLRGFTSTRKGQSCHSIVPHIHTAAREETNIEEKG